MPLYTYRCDTCGETLEILHAMDAMRLRCGLDCKVTGAFPFGKGEVTRLVQAPNLGTASKTVAPSREERRREARRQAALARMGGPMTDAELGRAKDAGLTVYRKESAGTWERDGAGAEGSPDHIRRPSGDE